MEENNNSIMAKRVAVVSLGCAKNLVDSDHIASFLEAAGLEVTTDSTEAPVVIVNTCGFIDIAKEESIDTILSIADLKDTGDLRRLIVTGCLSERYGSELREALPEVDVMLGIDPRSAARAALWGLGMRSDLPANCDLRSRRFTPDFWAYLRISDGCNNCCAYCSIPTIRGPLTSRPMESVLSEAQDLLHAGVQEINIIAQDTTAYWREQGDPQLHELLHKMNTLGDDFWIRLLYTHPAHYYPELINVLAESSNILPYLDIPLQHISDPVLKRMDRGTRRSEIENLLDTLRDRIDNLTLRTTFMVGFPGETEKDFNELMNFVRTRRFERMGAFQYSPEENTPAAGFTDQIDEETREQRYRDLMDLQQNIAHDVSEERIGTQTTVLIEEADETTPEDVICARGPAEAPDVDPLIFIETTQNLQPGQKLKAEIIDAHGYDCVARPVEGETTNG